MYLLDVNCLVALGWLNHVHHRRAAAYENDAVLAILDAAARDLTDENHRGVVEVLPI